MMGKLVRDRIPDIIRASGKVPKISSLDDEGYAIGLQNKLMEEAREVVTAVKHGSLGDQREEMADVLEVLHAMALHLGITWSSVEYKRIDKEDSHGGFGDRVWLEDYQ